MASNGSTSITVVIICLFIGFSLTIYSYNGSDRDSSYIVFYGAIIYGILKIIKGVYINSQDDNTKSTKYEYDLSGDEKFSSNLPSNIRISTSDPYADLSIPNTISDEDLVSSYKSVINEYNIAVNTGAVNIDELRNKIYIYKAIFKQRQ